VAARNGKSDGWAQSCAPDGSEAGSVAEDVVTSTLSAAGGVVLGVALGLWFLVRHLTPA